MSSKFRSMAAGLAAACFLTSMAGCTAANRVPQGTAPNTNLTGQGMVPNGTVNRQGINLSQNMTQGTNPNLLMPGTGYATAPSGLNTGSTAFDRQKADKIMTHIGNVDGARDIKAIVNGSTALVSYTPSGTLRNALATKSAIVKKVKTLDHTVKNVVVSESPDIISRMQKLSSDIINNKPATELNKIFNQLVQTVKAS